MISGTDTILNPIFPENKGSIVPVFHTLFRHNGSELKKYFSSKFLHFPFAEESSMPNIKSMPGAPLPEIRFPRLQ
jgi:hypothetical protein